MPDLHDAQLISSPDSLTTALQQSEQRYRMLVEQATEAIISLDLNGTVSRFNQAALHLTGYTVEEAPNVTFEELLGPAEFAESQERIARLLRREPVEMPWTVQVRCKDGRAVMLEVTCQVLWQDDQPVEIEVIGRDVTRRLTAEAGQRRQRERLAALLRVSEVVNYSLDLDRTLHKGLCVLNDLSFAAASAVFLLDPGEDGFSLCAHAGWPDEFLPAFECMPLRGVAEEALRTGRLQVPDRATVERCRAAHPDLAPVALNNVAIVPLIADGKALGTLHLDRPDDRPYSEQELQLLQAIANLLAEAIARAQVHQELRETAAANERLYREAEGVRSYLHMLIRNTPDVLLAIGADMSVRPLNPERLAAITGYRPAEVAGQPFLRLVPHHFHERLLEHWRAVLDGRPQSFEVEIVRVDGAPLAALASAALVPDYDEVFMILKDVTERKWIEAQIRQNEKLTALGRLVAGAAHELNNPLAAILGLAQLQLLEDLPPATRADIQEIERAALRISQIVQQFRAFTRSYPLPPNSFDVEPLIREALARLSAQFDAGTVEVVVDLAPDLPRIAGDPQQIEHALFNILHNALQALQTVPPGAPQRMTIQGRAEAGNLCLAIGDTGSGILPEHLAHVFDPFFTTRPVGQGTGLGLSIVHTIVQQHGGQVWAVSLPDQGATFHLTLPGVATVVMQPVEAG